MPPESAPEPAPGTGPRTLHTADGVDLEAELAWPDARTSGGPAAVVVLAHPHPAHGGSMRSLVTSELFRSLPAAGVAALRFNFRGVGASGGTHDGGGAEAHDVTAAVEALAAIAAEHAPGAPLVLSGWSFGADVSLTVDHPAIGGWVPVAPPLRFAAAERMGAVAADPRPKLLVVPEHDQFRSPASAAEHVAGWTATTVEVVRGGDHFLAGRTDVVRDHLVAFAAALRA